LNLRLGMEVPDTDAEGPGRRYAIWVQGCPMRCKGCCNPKLLPFEGGDSVSTDALTQRILEATRRHDLEGISLLGGEPFAHAEALALVCRAARDAGLTVMIYSGFTLAELGEQGPAAQELLSLCDLLVDGRYERDLPDTTRRWIGSTNQGLHFLTDAYTPTDPCFSDAETIELRWQDGELLLNGWPLAGQQGRVIQ